MKLVSDLRLVSEFSAVNAAPGGGGSERISVPFHHGEIEFPVSDLDGVIITGDLQFYDRKDVPEEDRRLMGFVVAEEIANLCEVGLLPPANRLGVILVGDLYADACLLKRGGSGDVEQIWEDFADRFRWVVGVAGNHDLFEGKDEFPNRFRKISNIHALDGDAVTLDGLRIAGVSGILGNPRKIWRYEEPEFWQSCGNLLNQPLDCLVLHQGPTGSKKGMRGASMINEVIKQSGYYPKMVAFGHCHWPDPVDTQGAVDLVNSDARIMLFTRQGVEVGI